MISGPEPSYINIHCHRLPENSEGQVHVLSVNEDFRQVSRHGLVSVGLHPWYISKTNPHQTLSQVQQYAIHPHVIAIGECGLDLLIDVPIQQQELFFKEQILLAETLRKPLIIHCVKAFNDLIRIKKEMNISVPAIVHGYNNNLTIARQLLEHGFCLSFGKALLTSGSNATNVIRYCPAESFFLETDDTDVSINHIFEGAAFYRNTSVEALKQQIAQNFKKVFLHE